MKKIYRYEFAEELGTCRGPDNPEYSCGQFVKHEDHLAALREIFSYWTGEYPTEDGWYYFVMINRYGKKQIGIVWFDAEDNRYYTPCDHIGQFVHGGIDKGRFGPKVPMWEEIQ